MAKLPKTIHSSHAVSVRIPVACPAEMDALALKSMSSGKGAQTAKTTLKKNKVGGQTLPGVRTYHKAEVSKTGGFCREEKRGPMEKN